MKAKKLYSYNPDYAVPPGETIREVMESYGMAQNELAVRLDTTPQTLNRIFKGEQPITYETANRLEMVTGTPASFWNNLESNYQEQLAKIEEKKRMESDLNWLKQIPVSELIDRKAISEEKETVEQLRVVLKFYGVSSVKAWNDIWEKPAVAARRSACFETQPGYASAWIRLGELQAHERKCKPYDKDKFKNVLQKIRLLTKELPQVFERKLIEYCAECGVVLALVKEMNKVPWSGATKWLSPDKAMILLNLRGKQEDKFWFSFFHEAGHILHDSKKDLLINDGSKDDPREVRAEEFAAEILIPSKYNEQICAATRVVEIRRIADELEVSPGIIVGRFHHLTNKWALFRNMIRKIQWA